MRGLWRWIFGNSRTDDGTSHYQREEYRRPISKQNSTNPKCATCPRHVYKVEHTHCYSCWKKLNPSPKKEKRVPPSTIQSYNRIIKMVSLGSGQISNPPTEENVKNVLCNQHNFHEDAANDIISSPIFRSMLQWN